MDNGGCTGVDVLDYLSHLSAQASALQLLMPSFGDMDLLAHLLSLQSRRSLEELEAYQLLVHPMVILYCLVSARIKLILKFLATWPDAIPSWLRVEIGRRY